jgi:hypothetical protein
MSQTLTREEELLKINQAKRERDQKRFTTMWIKRFVVAYLLCMAIYVIYLFAFQGLTIEFVGNIQKEYAKFLVTQNDEFVTLMVEFEALTSKTNETYTEAEKEAIQKNLEKQNEFLKKLQRRSPNEDNADYVDLYQDILQIYAFYIQGEIMMAEYCYAFDATFTLENQYSNSETSLETYTTGKGLCNMFGNMILNNYKYINDIRDTSYKSQHNIVELGPSNNSSTNDETSTENSTNTNDSTTNDTTTDNTNGTPNDTPNNDVEDTPEDNNIPEDGNE